MDIINENTYDTRIAPCQSTPAILKHLKSAHFSSKNGSFSVFCASHGHTRLRKRSPHAPLTLVSYYNTKRRNRKQKHGVIPDRNPRGMDKRMRSITGSA